MIREAKIEDLYQINELVSLYDLPPIEESVLRDVCFVSVLENEKIVGFIWAAIPPSKFIAYVDYMTVHPEHKGHGILLCHKVLNRLKEMDVKKVISVVVRNGDPSSIKSHSINMKIGLSPHEHPYTFFIGDVERMARLWAA